MHLTLQLDLRDVVNVRSLYITSRPKQEQVSEELSGIQDLKGAGSHNVNNLLSKR